MMIKKSTNFPDYRNLKANIVNQDASTEQKVSLHENVDWQYHAYVL